jgi:hypothetical protein
LETTAIQVMTAINAVKILVVYLFLSRPIIDSNLSACFGCVVMVLMAGDLNGKHVD